MSRDPLDATPAMGREWRRRQTSPMTPPDRAPEPLSAEPDSEHSPDYNRGWADGQASALDACNPIIESLSKALDALDAGPRSEEAGVDVNRVRRAILDDIGEALSRELAQGNPFEPFDRLRVAKTITRVLDEARDRIRVAEGAVR